MKFAAVVFVALLVSVNASVLRKQQDLSNDLPSMTPKASDLNDHFGQPVGGASVSVAVSSAAPCPNAVVPAPIPVITPVLVTPVRVVCGSTPVVQVDKCVSLTSCDQCGADPSCGWCAESNKCLPGNAQRCACDGACSSLNWLYGTISCEHTVKAGQLSNVAPEATHLKTPDYHEPQQVATTAIHTIQVVAPVVAAPAPCPTQVQAPVPEPVKLVSPQTIDSLCNLDKDPQYTTCQQLTTSCGACAANPACGWYAQSNACLPGTPSKCACAGACPVPTQWQFEVNQCSQVSVASVVSVVAPEPQVVLKTPAYGIVGQPAPVPTISLVVHHDVEEPCTKP